MRVSEFTRVVSITELLVCAPGLETLKFGLDLVWLSQVWLHGWVPYIPIWSKNLLSDDIRTMHGAFTLWMNEYWLSNRRLFEFGVHLVWQKFGYLVCFWFASKHSLEFSIYLHVVWPCQTTEKPKTWLAKPHANQKKGLFSKTPNVTILDRTRV